MGAILIAHAHPGAVRYAEDGAEEEGAVEEKRAGEGKEDEEVGVGEEGKEGAWEEDDDPQCSRRSLQPASTRLCTIC